MRGAAQRAWPSDPVRLQPAHLDPPPPKLRMAYATLRSPVPALTELAALVAQIHQWYRALEALREGTTHRHRSAAYRAIEAQIRALSVQHWALLGIPISAARAPCHPHATKAARVSSHSTSASPATALTD